MKLFGGLFITSIVVGGLIAHLAYAVPVVTIGAVCGLATTLVTVGGLIWKKALSPIFSHCSNIVDNTTTAFQQLDKISYELGNNGGKSIKDSIDRIEASLFLLESEYNIHKDNDSTVGVFKCLPSGSNLYVNRTYARWVGATKSEMLGFGWRNFLAPQLKETYDNEWKEAFSEGREIFFDMHMISTSGKPVDLDIRAYPIRNKEGKLMYYLGFLKKIIPPPSLKVTTD